MKPDFTPLVEKLRGRFIAFDGPDGAGKSTQRKLVADALEAAGVEVVSCRDPGGTQIGDRIRSVLLDNDLTPQTAVTNMNIDQAPRPTLIHAF